MLRPSVGRLENDKIYMAQLLGQINQNLVTAMKSKDAETTSVLRMLITAMRNKEIGLREKVTAAFVPSSGREELSDQQIIEIVMSEIKKHRDSVEAYTQGGRQELADKETREIKILEKYLPEQLGEAELEKIVKEVVASGALNFGKAMGQVMAKVKGQADGGKVGELVKKLLVK